jgi:tetratricopeptide (TPR) repeat protein
MKPEIQKINEIRELLKAGKLLESMREGIAFAEDSFPDFYRVFLANLELYETYLREKTRGLIISHKLEQLTANITNTLTVWEQFIDKAHEAYLERGNSFYSIRNYAAALENYEKSWENKPDFLPALIGIGQAYYGLEDYDNAIVYFDKAIAYQQFPYNAEAYQYKGNAFLMKKNMEEASKAYEIAQKLENLHFNIYPLPKKWSNYVHV